jgi:drug/metabolite transporter (DMT)-like permease
MLFWNADFTPRVGIGLVLVAIALFLCIYKGKEVDADKKKVTFRWIIFCLISFLGNAGCTITQKTQQLKFNGKYGNMLMMFATAMSVIVTLIIYLKSDRSDSKVIFKNNFYLPILSGASNVILNLFVMLLAVSSLSPTLVYPTIAVGGLILTALISLIVFKEKLRWWQWLGVVVGIVATAILS